MSRLLRDGGALFMRRSFRNDKVYSAAFKTYLQTLLTKADAPLEVFIEGTRSRSGKSLMPKFGTYFTTNRSKRKFIALTTDRE